jgi:hypothetical protein
MKEFLKAPLEVGLYYLQKSSDDFKYKTDVMQILIFKVFFYYLHILNGYNYGNKRKRQCDC